MLIFARRAGESLMIGDDVVVTVLGIKGNKIRIGVDAPRDKAVHREEIFHKIKGASPDGNLHGSRREAT